MNVIIEHWLKNKFHTDVGMSRDLKTLKWMPGDLVAPDDGRVIKRTAGHIVGIIDILNRTRFGTTPRGVPLYILYPIDVSYPPCLVALKTKPESNMLAVVQYEHWDGIWPRTGFVKSLGPVGDLKSEIEAMLQTLPPLPPASEPSSSSISVDMSKHHVVDWNVVLHIDPPGCKDVDDVFCWTLKGSTHATFAIGIADVAAWVPEGSELDRIACLRGSTLYNDGTAVAPMFPPWLSESAASLRCDGVLRPAVCLTFDLEYVDDVWRVSGGPRFELHMLRVTDSYTYDTIHENTDHARWVRTFVSAVWGTMLDSDSHEWVERAMIVYNRTVAEELSHANVGLLRAHEGIANEQYSTLAAETGCREIGWLGSAAGRYVVPAMNTPHIGLGLARYTHASSPLRRYVDVYNQRWIRGLLFGFPVPNTMVHADLMNCRAKRIHQLERDMYFLSRVLGGDNRTNETVDGYLLSKSKKSEGAVDRWRTYVPEWKRVVTCVFAASSCDIKPGARITVRVFFNIRQANSNARFIYQATTTTATAQNRPHEELS